MNFAKFHTEKNTERRWTVSLILAAFGTVEYHTVEYHTIEVDESIDDLKQKVKKLVSTTEITGAPVLFSGKYADRYEYYLYPYDEKLKTELTQKYDDHVEVEDLNLNDIVKSFIGSQYV